MDIEITSKKENPLLGRTEVRFKAFHPDDTTPQRATVRDQLAGLLGASKGLVVLDSLKTRFGRTDTEGYAKVYENTDKLHAVESDHILKRNGISTGEEKAAEAAAATEE